MRLRGEGDVRVGSGSWSRTVVGVGEGRGEGGGGGLCEGKKNQKGAGRTPVLSKRERRWNKRERGKVEEGLRWEGRRKREKIGVMNEE